MLEELIHNKIKEIFAEYQKENNIPNGDIDPWDAQRLEQIETALAELIKRVGNYQKREAKFECIIKGK